MCIPELQCTHPTQKDMQLSKKPFSESKHLETSRLSRCYIERRVYNKLMTSSSSATTTANYPSTLGDLNVLNFLLLDRLLTQNLNHAVGGVPVRDNKFKEYS